MAAPRPVREAGTAPDYSFLRRPIWIGGAVLALLAAGLFARLGIWQLDRHDQRQELAAEVRAAQAAPPVDLAAELASGTEPADLEFRSAVVRGTFTPGDTVALLNRSRRGTSGFHVLDPLTLDGGGTVVVDRGFVALPALEEGTVPAPPSGTVVIEGRVRLSRDGGRLTTAGGGAVAARLTRPDLDRLADHWQRGLAPAYVELATADPPPGPADPIPADPPEIGAGPHLGYAFQWFAFAAIAVVGFAVLVYRTARRPGTDGAGRVRYRRAPQPGSRH